VCAKRLAGTIAILSILALVTPVLPKFERWDRYSLISDRVTSWWREIVMSVSLRQSINCLTSVAFAVLSYIASIFSTIAAVKRSKADKRANNKVFIFSLRSVEEYSDNFPGN